MMAQGDYHTASGASVPADNQYGDYSLLNMNQIN